MKWVLPLIVAVTLVGPIWAQDEMAPREPLTEAQQSTFLARRTKAAMFGRFGSFGSLLYALYDIVIHSDSKRINDTTLHSPFPDFYQPTWAESFDSIARQTQSTWHYDAARNCWVFAEPAAALPYHVDIAKGWRTEDRGMYVFYGPKDAPVGMDIYMLGRYSAKQDEQATFDRVREALALQFAGKFAPDISVDKMQKVRAGDSPAIYFETADTPQGIIWRQWVIVERGYAIVIVSAIKPEDDATLWPDVKQMVASFKITPSNNKKPQEKPEQK